MGEERNFYKGLLYELFRFLYYFNCHMLPSLMIHDFEHLAKGSSVDGVDNLIPERNMVSDFIAVELGIL